MHVLPPHMFEGEGRFAETVAALNPEKLEQMIVDAQKAAAELGNLTTCLCCDAQCKFNPCSDYSTAATPPTNNVCFVLQCFIRGRSAPTYGLSSFRIGPADQFEKTGGSGGLAPREVRRAAEIFGILDPANARFYSKT